VVKLPEVRMRLRLAIVKSDLSLCPLLAVVSMGQRNT